MGLLKDKSYLSAFIFFCVAAFMGVVLRLFFSIDMPEWLSYGNIRNGHSHVALLGWLMASFILIIIEVFHLNWKRYALLFASLQLCVLAMSISFPIYGYASLSIIFTTLHLILMYVFVTMIWREISTLNDCGVASKYLKGAIIYLVISSLGPWALGLSMATGIRGSAFYYGSIQWYLHFMFNGWLTFSLFAIFFKFLENRSLEINVKHAKIFFNLLIPATILTFALAVTWSNPFRVIFYVNSLGVILQLIAIFYFVRIVVKLDVGKLGFTGFGKILWGTALFSIILKILIQTAVVIPYIARISYTIKNFVIGFIHLLMLGALTLFIFGFLHEVLKYRIHKPGSWLFIAGIVLTELFLFLQGLFLWLKLGFIPYYYHVMSAGSFLLFLGILLITLNFRTPIMDVKGNI